MRHHQQSPGNAPAKGKEVNEYSELELNSTSHFSLTGRALGSEQGSQDYSGMLNLSGARIVDEKWLLSLVNQRDSYRAVLEGAEYRDINEMGGNSVEGSRQIGVSAKESTLAIIAQRDELLALLQECLPHLDTAASAFKAVKPVRNKVRDAIAKAKGGAV